jgi:hypothetical protein
MPCSGTRANTVEWYQISTVSSTNAENESVHSVQEHLRWSNIGASIPGVHRRSSQSVTVLWNTHGKILMLVAKAIKSIQRAMSGPKH